MDFVALTMVVRPAGGSGPGLDAPDIKYGHHVDDDLRDGFVPVGVEDPEAHR